MKEKIILLVFLFSFAVVMGIISLLTSIESDEGTHALLALFYRDGIFTALSKKEFSFQKLYNFSISYLIHYPKLQVFYPPLYHLITGIVFYSLLGVSAFTARLSNLFMCILTIIIFYFTVKDFYKKGGLIATILFALSPMTLILGHMAMTEFTVLFFIIASLYFYKKAWKNNLRRDYLLCSIMTSLAILSKQPGLLLIPTYSLHMLYRKKIKELFLFILPILIILLPYSFLIMKINGLEMLQTIYSAYAFELIEVEAFLRFPFYLILFIIFIYQLRKWKDDEKFLALWFFIFLPGIFLISFKERYFLYFLIPTFILTDQYLYKKGIKFCLIFILAFTIISIGNVTRTIRSYPIESLSKEIYYTLPPGANVAMFSESGDRYSSAFMFNLATLDKNKTLFFYRPCLFYNKTRETIIDLIKKNNIYYIIAVPNQTGYENVKVIGDILELEKNQSIQIFKIKNFTFVDQKTYCNYVCLTNEMICTEYRSPFYVYSQN